MENHGLDDPQLYKEYDPAGMLTHLHEMPRLCERAWRLMLDFQLPPGYEGINKIVILGMGGSAIGGDLAAGLALPEAGVPVIVSRGYELPAFTDANTLIIASSYSGKLKTMAEEKRVPVFSFDYKSPPRAALPFSLMPIIGLLQKLGVISDKSADVAETITILKQLSSRINETAPMGENPAKQMAAGLSGRVTVVYGAGIVSEVARRWKTQLNENSKSWAFYELLPELNHNAVIGYRFPADSARRIAVVFLRSNLLPKRIRLRYQITHQLLKEAGVDGYFSEGQGKSPLSQIMSLVLSGDYVSYYLALLNKIDPSPVKEIDLLKEQLKQHGDND